jgi:formamidopyrimidine-DNA glycosylase
MVSGKTLAVLARMGTYLVFTLEAVQTLLAHMNLQGGVAGTYGVKSGRVLAVIRR